MIIVQQPQEKNWWATVYCTGKYFDVPGCGSLVLLQKEDLYLHRDTTETLIAAFDCIHCGQSTGLPLGDRILSTLDYKPKKSAANLNQLPEPTHVILPRLQYLEDLLLTARTNLAQNQRLALFGQVCSEVSELRKLLNIPPDKLPLPQSFVTLDVYLIERVLPIIEAALEKPDALLDKS